jgi:chromosome segregation ATPase
VHVAVAVLQDVQDAHAELEARHAAVVDVLSRIENRTRVDLHNEVQDLAAKLAAAQQRLQQEHALRNSVTHQLQASQASVTGKDMQLQAARVELAAAKQQLESKEQELQAAQRQQVADMQRADAAKAALDQERQRAGDLTGELRAANRRRQQDASVLQNRLAAAEREFQQQFKSQAEHHQAELLSLNVALQDVLRANEELRRENKGLHTQLEACDSRGA